MPFGDTYKNAAAYLDRLVKRPSFARALKEAEPYRALFPNRTIRDARRGGLRKADDAVRRSGFADFDFSTSASTQAAADVPRIG